jgi:hypothetical protein
MVDTLTKRTDQEIWGDYASWKELRPFKYCLIKPRSSDNIAAPTERMEKVLYRAFQSAAYRHKIKDGNLMIDGFLHEMYDQVLLKDSFYSGRLYTPKEVVENLFKMKTAIPDLLKGARPSYAQIAAALGMPDTYTHD